MKTDQRSLYVQYGCGLCAPTTWTNFDASPTLRIQKIPIVGRLLSSYLNTVFPANVLYGDIIKGLPVPKSSCKGIYCSHTLEHLSLSDFRVALRNTYAHLQEGGVFRCVVPDLQAYVSEYASALNDHDPNAALTFLRKSMLGKETRPRGIRAMAGAIYGNANHLWMWDKYSLGEELRKAGFRDIRVCDYNDSTDPMFKDVEDKERFQEAVALEARK